MSVTTAAPSIVGKTVVYYGSIWSQRDMLALVTREYDFAGETRYDLLFRDDTVASRVRRGSVRVITLWVESLARQTRVPVVEDDCEVCGEKIDLFSDNGSWELTRINGNSAYGYAPCHTYH